MSKIDWTKYKEYDWSKMPDPGKSLPPAVEGIELTKVGIGGYTSPVDIVRKDGTTFRDKGTFSIYSQLNPIDKGVHMSRMTRAVQAATINRGIDNAVLEDIADSLLAKLESDQIYLKMKFEYPLKQESLVSKNKETGAPNFGWMYYPSTIELRKNVHGSLQAYCTIEYMYSSTCPCSLLLAGDFTEQTGGKAFPHAQRSILTTTVEFDIASDFHIEDLIMHHRETIRTEVLGSTVLREDELGFSVLAAEQPLFCEDAARYMYSALKADKRIKNISLCAEHLESLHPSSAIAIINDGLPGKLGY